MLVTNDMNIFKIYEPRGNARWITWISNFIGYRNNERKKTNKNIHFFSNFYVITVVVVAVVMVCILTIYLYI